MENVGNIMNITDQSVKNIIPDKAVDLGMKDSEKFGQIMEKASKNNTVKPEEAVEKDTGNVKSVSANHEQGKENVKVKSDGDGMREEADVTMADATVDEVSGKIITLVEDVMDVDDQTLMEFMLRLGFTPLDLLQETNLKQLVVAVGGGEDMMSLLTDENLMNNFNQLMDSFMEMKQTLQMPVMDVVPESTTGDNYMSVDMMNAVQTAILDSQENVDEDSVNVVATLSESDVAAEYSEPVISVDVSKNDNARPVTYENTSDGADDANVINVKDFAKKLEDSMQNDSDGDDDSSGFEEHRQITGQNTTKELKNDNIINTSQTFTMNSATEVREVVTVTRTTMVEIVTQVVEHIRVNINENNTSMEIQLNPHNLGKVLLNVTAKEGIMTAHFTVQTEEARLALENQMSTLKETFNNKEIKVEAVEVTVSNFEFTQGQGSEADRKDSDQGDGRARRYKIIEGEDEDDGAVNEAEHMRRQVMRDNGGSIDFTA